MAEDLALLINAARGAADIARSFWQADQRSWTKADSSPVTEADVAVDKYLRESLLAARPDYGWLSEETPDDPDHRSGDITFIVDPIDGTRAFAAGERTWAHSLAIARNGRIETAVVHLPLRDKLYTATRGGGAFLNGRHLRVSDRTGTEGASLLASRAVFEPHFWGEGGVPGFKRAFRPALAYRLALVAEGRYDGLLSLRPVWEWDIAAGTLLVTEAGGVAGRPDRTAHCFNSPDRRAAGLAAANPELFAAILDRLA